MLGGKRITEDSYWSQYAFRTKCTSRFNTTNFSNSRQEHDAVPIHHSPKFYGIY